MKMSTRNEMIERAGRVAVLFGGASAERDISLKSGREVIASLVGMGIEVVEIDAGLDLAARVLDARPDRVFNILHGRGGEDGVVQGLLTSMGIPYTGSGVLASALAMDKLRSKLLSRQMGLPTADFEILTSATDWDSLQEKFGRVVVKPASEGSSIGMSITDLGDELETAYHEAARFDPVVLGERYIDGDEYTVTVLGEEVLPAIQLQTDRQFYDYAAKYVSNDTRYLCPVDLGSDALNYLNNLTSAAFNALGCEGWGRVDAMRDRQGQFYLLEVNTVPGMTDHSLVPMAARQAGIEFEDLLLRILFAKRDASNGEEE
jgi:D-alanine-D-alanine ligase